MTAPLVPPEVNLRGLPWMRLDVGRLLNSDLFALSSGDQFKYAVTLWCRSWTQTPAGSLPDDDKILAMLAGAGSRKNFVKNKLIVLRGWVKCDDGRLYHPVISEYAILAWKERLQYLENKENHRKRQELYRLECKELRAKLREHGVKAPFNTKVEDLRERLRVVEDDTSTRDNPVTRTVIAQSEHGDSTVTASCGGREGEGDKSKSKSFSSETYARSVVSEGSAPELARALQGVGFPECAATLPGLIEAKAEGVTSQELIALATAHAGKALNYIIAKAIGQRRDARERAGAAGPGTKRVAIDPQAQALAAAEDACDRAIRAAANDFELGLKTPEERDKAVAAARETLLQARQALQQKPVEA